MIDWSRRSLPDPGDTLGPVDTQGAASTTTDRPRAALVILAGGMGTRMGADVNKVYLQIRGRHMLDYSVTTALGCKLITHLVLVHRRDDTEHINRLVADFDRPSSPLTVHTTLGGETRHDSEYAGVAALRTPISDGRLDVVAIHDGARPFMGGDLLHRSLVGAATHAAVIPGLPVNDALYALDRRRFIDPHDHVWVQTPQAFDAAVLLAAHDAAHADEFQGVDTAEVVQRFSDVAVRVIPGHEANLKITYQTDLSLSETLADEWAAASTPID